MRTIAFWKLVPGLLVAVIPLMSCLGEETATSASPDIINTNQDSAVSLDTFTNAPSAEIAEQQLENASGQVVSNTPPPVENVALSRPAAEIVRMAQAGVEENVMLSFVTNSSGTFGLSADAIVYLNDLGISSALITSMIQHDQTIRTAYVTPAGAQPPDYTNPNVPAAGTSTYPGPDSGMMNADASGQPPEMTNDMAAYQQPNSSSTYFYNTLSPYGTWINVNGYGLCWQPTATVVNRGWQPYCNNGYWVYSDCGWYWASDYSWGWAPFHYGRWFHHNRWGWCWAPDTVWGPSWVSWRYTGGYCGWAPLPPTACFTPGFGFSCFGRPVSFGYGFGLASSCYTFVPTTCFYGYRPFYWRVPTAQVNHFFNHTVALNQMVESGNHRIINKGIPVDHNATAMHARIQPVQIQSSGNPAVTGLGRLNRSGSLTVFRPDFPLPVQHTLLVGEGVKPASAPSLFPHELRSPVATTVRSGIRPDPVSPGRNFTAPSPSQNPWPNRAVTIPHSESVASFQNGGGTSQFQTSRSIPQPWASGYHWPRENMPPPPPATGAESAPRLFNNSSAVQPSVQSGQMRSTVPQGQTRSLPPAQAVQRGYNTFSTPGYHQNNFFQPQH